MFINTEFYPTPMELIKKMMDDINLNKIQNILEPSAGKGDIVKFINEKCSKSFSRNSSSIDIDVIEIDEKLQYILKGENFRVVHNDFLTYDTYKVYDLIVMNPPFSNGEKHLLKAIDLQKNGGRIVCLLNAETLKNPFTNSRKDLIRKLNEYNASVEYLESAFENAERKTFVEVALVKVNITKNENSIILENLKKEDNFTFAQQNNLGKGLAISEFLNRIVQQYNFEVKAGVQLINEYYAMAPYLLKSIKGNPYNDKILSLTIDGDKDSTTLNQKINSFIKSVRYKYWYALFQSDQFTDLFTSNLRHEYYEKINELVDFDFSLYNIYKIQEDFSKALLQSVEDTIINLFDELSHKYHWHPETGNNIHYFNGWKTNKSWKINKKVIIPLNAYSDWNNDFSYDYKITEKLSDIEKALSYLDRGLINHKELNDILSSYQNRGISKKIPLTYFTVTFYKKGTCHIEFTSKDLLDKFNLFGSTKKGWLPSSYGEKNYNNMTSEEKEVIDNFQGKEEYEKVMRNKDYFLFNQSQLDFIGSGQQLLIG